MCEEFEGINRMHHYSANEWFPTFFFGVATRIHYYPRPSVGDIFGVYSLIDRALDYFVYSIGVSQADDVSAI
jgi:hypothetical protein